MKKVFKNVASITLATALLATGVPYNAFAASELSVKELEKVNKLTKAKVESTSTVKISKNINTSSNKYISVIIQLESDPVVVAKSQAKESGKKVSEKEVQSTIAKEQSSFVKNAKNFGIKLDVGRKYQHVLNGLEVKVRASDIPELANIPGVKSVFENAHYYVSPEVQDKATGDLPSGKYDLAPLKQIGVPEMWAAGLTGKGLKVGVIDTGVDYVHPDLKDAYKGGYDSIDNDRDPYEQAPITAEEDTEDRGGYEGSTHGSHVSGTIVGRAANSKGEIQHRGVAYEADLYVYRVLGRDGGSSAQVIDGIEKAVKDGMDVINLSLGSDLEKNADSPDAIAVNNAVLAGVVTVIANGNAAQNYEGQHFYTAGSPAGAKLPITVGAVTPPSVQYDSTASSSFGKNYEMPVMSWETLKDDFKSIVGTSALPVVYADLGSKADFEQVDVKDKVALVSRGFYAFTEKIENAKDAGAKAIIIFNGNDADGDDQADLNNPGREGNIGVFLGDQLTGIPTFDMSGQEGWALAKELLADPNKAKTLTFTFSPDYPKTDDPGDKMAGFSSRGPVLDEEYSIKPDVSAPGVSILSTIAEYGKYDKDADYSKAYSRLQGTSMATPHVAGLSLLLKQAHPKWTPFDIKAALANTAKRISNEDGTEYDVYSQGAGRVDGVAAMKTPAVLQTVEPVKILDKDYYRKVVTNYGDNLSFGLMKAGANAKTKTLQLKNLSKDEVTYTAEIVMHSKVTSDPYNPVDTPDSDAIKVELSTDEVTAKAGKAQKFTISLVPDSEAATGVYEGEVLLKSDAGHPDLHLPFVVHVGNEREETHFGMDNMKLSSDILSPNGDGVNESLTVSVLLQATDVNMLELQAWGVNDKYIGTMATLSNKNKENFAPGTVKFTNVTGTYVNGSAVVNRLEEGEYKLRVVAYNVDESKPEGEQVSSFYEIWKNFYFSMKTDKGLLKKVVDKAKSEFKAEIENTEEVGKAVLGLPEDTEEVSYAVTKSSITSLIDNDGTLKALPSKEEGAKEVSLTVTIASVADPSVKTTVKVKVELNPEE